MQAVPQLPVGHALSEERGEGGISLPPPTDQSRMGCAMWRGPQVVILCPGSGGVLRRLRTSVPLLTDFHAPEVGPSLSGDILLALVLWTEETPGVAESEACTVPCCTKGRKESGI